MASLSTRRFHNFTLVLVFVLGNNRSLAGDTDSVLTNPFAGNAEAVSYVGKIVTASGNKSELVNGQAQWHFAVAEPAEITATVRDMNGNVVDWNRQAEALFGWSRVDAIGRSVLELMGTGGTRGVLERALEEYRDAGASTLFNRLIEEKATRRDGAPIPVELAIAPVRLSTGLFFSAFVRDISDRKRLEEDLHAAQRLPRARGEQQEQ